MPSCLDVSKRNDILERAMSAPGTSHGPVSLEASYCEQARACRRIRERTRHGTSKKTNDAKTINYIFISLYNIYKYIFFSAL